MRARGHYRLRMVRNPLHLFTTTRDRRRYSRAAPTGSSSTSSPTRSACCARPTRGLAIPTVVIGNGVDVDRFRPPTATSVLGPVSGSGSAPSDRMVLFIGNEFGRKGLAGPRGRRRRARSRGASRRRRRHARPDRGRGRPRPGVRLGARLPFAGAHPDPRPWLHAADVLAMPSAYESYGLVVLEALACGVPVVATPTGCVPDVITEGVNGSVVDAHARGTGRRAAPRPRPSTRQRRGPRPGPARRRHSWADGRAPLPRRADRTPRRPGRDRRHGRRCPVRILHAVRSDAFAGVESHVARLSRAQVASRATRCSSSAVTRRA